MTAAYERKGQAIAREDFYRLACDPQRHVTVEACAGAGKTWILVSRILRALLEGVAPHEILAITFTKKAAGEMRHRLLQWLEEFSQAEDAQLLKELLNRGVSADRAAELIEPLRGLHRHLLGHGRGVQIRTFHSWFAALLRTAPLSVLQGMGLPASYDLLEQDAGAIAQVWRPLMARLLQQPAERADYEALVQQYGRSQVHKALEAALQRRVEFGLADAAGVVEASVPEAASLFPELAGLSCPGEWLLQQDVRQRWLAWARLLGQEKNTTPQQAAQRILQTYQQLDRGKVETAVQALRDALFVQKEDRLNRHLEKMDAARQAEPELQRLCQAQQQHEAWHYQQRLTRLSRLLMGEYAALKRERGWVDMNDVEQAALVLLKDSVLSGWVQQRLDVRIRQLLIDEFQDTNPLQWQALYAWLSAYAGSGGGAQAPSLFIVGDPKQSIYRFRRAEPQVFRAAQDFVLELGGELLSCDHTQRCAGAVLAAVNAALGQAQADGNYTGFRAHSTASPLAGQVLALPITARPSPSPSPSPASAAWRDSLTMPRHQPEDPLRERECHQAASWIASQIQSGLPPGEIMVLARKRDRLSGMEAALRALGIAAQQPEKTDLGQAPEVQDLTALLDVLVSPAHDLSLARVLKSPLFGLTDQDLIEIALRQRSQGLSWFELLQQAGLPETLQTVGKQLLLWQQWTASLPPHDALHAIYQDGDVLARFVAAAPTSLRQSVAANLQALLGAALQVDGGRYATPYGLVRALRAGGISAPQAVARDAVQLLTIHGAKGLEAELVLLLDTDAPAQRAQTMGVLLDWPAHAELPQSLIFLASENRLPPSVRDAFSREQAERAREELNTLYVALTRAKRTLVLSAAEPATANASSPSWWQRLQPLSAALAESEMSPSHVQSSGSPEIVLPVLPPVHFESPASHEPVQGRADTPQARIGSAMHRLLEWCGLDEVDLSSAQIEAVAVEFQLDADQAQAAALMARRILQGEGAWAWQGKEIGWHGNEVPVCVQGRVGRIDRLVQRRDGQWWVLDYKSATQPQAQTELLEQLRGYRAAVRASYPDAPVRAAFLSASGALEEIE
ncbi:MAG: UvrD-helicase domain-containing protein [Hylemonella sp.]